MKTFNKTLKFPKWEKAICNAGALLGIAMLGIVPYSADAQQIKKIGSVANFKLGLTTQTGNAASRTAEGGFSLATSDASLSAKINSHKVDGAVEHFIGSVNGSPNSTVFFHFKEGKVNGKAVLLKEKKSYEYSTNNLGEVEVKEANINNVVCVDYKSNQAAKSNATISAAPPTGSSVYNLQSLPGSNNVLKLDFDGEYVANTIWNGGNPITALPYDITEAGVIEAWEIISEDFRAFNINVTTSEAVFQAAPKFSRMKCIFTPTTTAYPGSGGVAYIGSFQWNDDTPCWVFNGGAKIGAETGSHELGHVMGLSHDGRTTPSEEYYGGTATWAPIMGYSYYSEPGHWSRGEYANANNTEDDISIIANMPASSTTTVGFRTDEAGSTNATSKLLVTNAAGVIDATQNIGIITSRTDVDVYRFTTTGSSTVNITVGATIPAHANLDVILSLKNSAGTTVASANPTTSMDATVSATLAAGTYYLFVDGTGLGDPVGIGYSDYSSIGRYKITGNISTTSYLTKFSVPRTTALPTLFKQSTKVYVLGTGGPDMSMVFNSIFNWNLANNQLVQFTLERNSNPYFTELKNFSTNTFNQAQPKIVINGSTGYPGLAGTYFINYHNGNVVLVEQTGKYALYFSTSTTPPNVRIEDLDAVQTETSSSEEMAMNGLLVSPNPSESEFHTLVQKDVAMINIADLQGRSVYSKADLAKDESFSFGSQLVSGIYMVQVRYVDGTQESFKIVKSK